MVVAGSCPARSYPLSWLAMLNPTRLRTGGYAVGSELAPASLAAARMAAPFAPTACCWKLLPRSALSAFSLTAFHCYARSRPAPMAPAASRQTRTMSRLTFLPQPAARRPSSLRTALDARGSAGGNAEARPPTLMTQPSKRGPAVNQEFGEFPEKASTAATGDGLTNKARPRPVC